MEVKMVANSCSIKIQSHYAPYIIKVHMHVCTLTTVEPPNSYFVHCTPQ